MDNQKVPPQESSLPTENNGSSIDSKPKQNTPANLTSSSLFKLIAGYALITGLLGAILLGGFFLTKQQNKPSSSVTPTITVSPTNNGSPTTTPEPLLSILRHDGMCPTSECTSETFIYKDGSIVKDGKTIKQLPIEQVKQLQNRFITTNFGHIRDFRFTGTCPTAYDGQESIYTFYLPDRSESFESCGYDLSQSGIFTFVEGLIKPEGILCDGPKNIQCDSGYWCSSEGEASRRTIGGTCIKVQPARRSGEGETCNGVAALQCETGYVCYMPPGSEKIADASGTCVKQTTH